MLAYSTSCYYTVLPALTPVSVICRPGRNSILNIFSTRLGPGCPGVGLAGMRRTFCPLPLFTFGDPGSFRMLVTLVTNFLPPLRTRASNIYLPGIVLHRTGNIYFLPSKHPGPGFLTLHGG